MLDYRSTIVAAGVVVGALHAGCTDPDLPTDLRTSGPPHVTVVTVMSDLENEADPASTRSGFGRIIEDATFCRLGDNKRPNLVGLPDIRVIQVCPDDLGMKAPDDGVAQAAPPSWFVRVVFDELLDPSIEDLVPILDASGVSTGVTRGTFQSTQPVTLKCDGVDVAYDGYYVPNGNKQSWPLGPALFVAPLSATDVKTGASCTVSVLDKVQNKARQSLAADQRSFTFQLAPMSLRFTDPDPGDKLDGSILVDPKAAVQLFWTAEIKAGVTITTPKPDPKLPKDTITLSDLDPTKVNITSAPNLNVSASNPDGDPDPTVCDGSGGTPVDPAAIRAYLGGPDATSSALVLQLDVGGPTAQKALVWAPSTTYLLTFADGAAVTPKQGGNPGVLPGAKDFSLCFHTSAAPAN
jgi:hypothetical protein